LHDSHPKKDAAITAALEEGDSSDIPGMERTQELDIVYGAWLSLKMWHFDARQFVTYIGIQNASYTWFA